MVKGKIVIFNNERFEMTEDDKRVYFKELSDRKNKAHFSLSKVKGDGDKAKEGLKIFWSEVFSYINEQSKDD
ncbi:hypothetical protein [Bacillus sp. ISL-37]|uniref:hypothetical protein n=1 Tax=Bacillus sp. ISL-37 TaxID=2819123 RepID=UPI001BEBD489|nr:hypothetical protein [Bacillus sp. ISL-37]MBT2682630.1 hypothetical protein [Bacillus sp. ISL-37]